MPDPAAAFGAAAGAVQLADVALRASREAYSFLCAVKDLKFESLCLTATLRGHDIRIRKQISDVNATVKNECHTIAQTQESTRRSITADLSSLHQDMCRRLEENDQSLRNIQQNTAALLSTQSDLSQRRIEQLHGVADESASGLSAVVSSTMISVLDIGALTKIFRAEVRSVLKPIVEQSFSKSEIQNEFVMSRLSSMIDGMSNELGRHTSRQSNADEKSATEITGQADQRNKYSPMRNIEIPDTGNTIPAICAPIKARSTPVARIRKFRKSKKPVVLSLVHGEI